MRIRRPGCSRPFCHAAARPQPGKGVRHVRPPRGAAGHAWPPKGPVPGQREA